MFLSCFIEGESIISLKDSQNDNSHPFFNIPHLETTIAVLNNFGAKITIDRNSLKIKKANFVYKKEKEEVSAYFDINVSLLYLLLFSTKTLNIKIKNLYKIERSYLNFKEVLETVIEDEKIKEELSKDLSFI